MFSPLCAFFSLSAFGSDSVRASVSDFVRLCEGVFSRCVFCLYLLACVFACVSDFLWLCVCVNMFVRVGVFPYACFVPLRGCVSDCVCACVSDFVCLGMSVFPSV